jgi:hypothetical protein
MKKSIILICLAGLGLISVAACVLNYYRLGSIPYGFHVDEMSSSVDIGCMATKGVDAHNNPHPLFANLNYGTPKPPTFIYPAVLWAKVFGYSIPSLRALNVSVHIWGIVGLFLLARSFFGWQYALLTTTLGCISPWTWPLSRVAFESLYALTFLIWGLYFFFKPPKIWSVVLTGLFLAAAMYSYPPFRMQTPLMVLTLIIYARWKNPWPFKSWIILMGTMALSLIPLIQKTLNGELQNRFNYISIFSKDFLNSIHSSGGPTDIIRIFVNNYLMHFSWDFLVLRGDPSYVHSTRHFGILSWLDLAALALALVWVFMLFIKRYRDNNPLVLQKNFLFFLISNVFIGVLPAALTNSEIPNSLRITGAWPFVCLLSGYLLWQSCERWWGLWIGILVLSIGFAVAFFNVYFTVFPQEGKGMFEYWAFDEARQIKTDEDWLKFVVLYRYQDYTTRYYLMQYHGFGCKESQDVWQGVGNLLNSQGRH